MPFPPVHFTPFIEKYIEIPVGIPIQLVDKNRSLPAAYHMRHFDNWLAEEQILENESAICNPQKWQFDDIVHVQLISSIAPISVKVRNEKGEIVIDQLMSQVAVIRGRVYWENQIAIDNNFTEGRYKVYYSFGDPVQVELEAETWDVRADHPGTLLFTYSNNFNNQILWQTGIYMNFRVDGVVAEYLPVAAPGRTVYLDQPGNAKTVKGGSARQFTAFVGNRIGMPPWQIDKLEEIMNQNNVSIDGKDFSADAGAKWSPKRIQRYAWAQWSLDIRETNTSRVKRFTSTGILEKKFVEDVVVDGKLFGAVVGPSNDNTYTINSVQ